MVMKIMMKKIYKVLFLLISFNSNAQTYMIDSLKVLNGDRIYFSKAIDLKIVHDQEYLKFYKLELNPHTQIKEFVLYQTWKTTKANYFNNKVRFVAWGANYDLQFFEVSEHWMIEKYIGFTKVYHIKTIYP